MNEVAPGSARPPGAFECRPCRENRLSVRDGHLDTSREGTLVHCGRRCRHGVAVGLAARGRYLRSGLCQLDGASAAALGSP